jgi:hypothetical protein
MKKIFAIPLALLLMGSILTVVGANSYVNESNVALCMACGMKVAKSDPSTLLITSPGQPDQWACCPVCAAQVGLYYKNAVITGTCTASGKTITFNVKDVELTSVSPDTTLMLAGGSCMKNKLACDEANAATLKTRFDWAASAPLKTSAEFFDTAKMKLSTATIAPKPSLVSTPSYLLLGSGLLLVALAPVAWIYFRRRENHGA